MTGPATSTLEASLGVAMSQFSQLCLAGVSDATAIFHTIHGLNDGNYYGRYFGQPALKTYAGAAGSVDNLIAWGVAWRQTMADVVAAALSYATDPALFGQAATGLTETLRAACANPADSIRLLSALAQFSVFLPAPGGDAIGAQILALGSRAALRLRLAAAASLVRATTNYQPLSQAEALALRDSVGDLLDNLAVICADIFDDRSAAALDVARVAIVNDLTARGASLAPVIIRTLPMPMPGSVEAQALYQDGSRGDELVARNDPPHPGFMPRTIEALAA